MIERVECGPDISGARSDARREGFNSERDSDDLEERSRSI